MNNSSKNAAKVIPFISHGFVPFLQLAKEAQECEEKEERLVSDAVKNLSETNAKLNALEIQLKDKTAESLKQKEEVTHLLAQVRFRLKALKRS